MAAISTNSTTTTTFTSPNNQDADSAWDYPGGNTTNFPHARNGSISSEFSQKNATPNYGVNDSFSSQQPGRVARKMYSADNFHTGRSNDSGSLLPPHHIEARTGRASPAGWDRHDSQRSTDEAKRSAAVAMGIDPDDPSSKWIHRDKLARIESQELQAAGIFIPRSRAPSKQRRERSQPAPRRATDASDQSQNRSRKNSAAVEQRAAEIHVPSWDLRTPEEIAEEEANAYFMTNSGVPGGSRIPVAKTSPAPISLDYLERGSPAARKQTESVDGDTIAISKVRSRSESVGGKEQDLPGQYAPKGTAKRSVTDSSPKKTTAAGRKVSAPTKTATTPQRPKTRSGSSSGTRPSTRSGEKQMEGEPPWMANSYKPDPRLPPDQQLIPTVAKRLQQEKWEKEGTFGDAYDREFRPLNDNVLKQPPPEPEKAHLEEETRQEDGEWPLKREATKSPNLRQGGYSTMPRITDKPPNSPIPGPRSPSATQQRHQQSQASHRAPETPTEEPKKGGCGCCVVM